MCEEITVAQREAGVSFDAWDVAREIADRSWSNLSKIRRRLEELGYEFANPEQALTEAGPAHLKSVESLEGREGRVPAVLRAWYERIESVDFSQAEEQRRGDRESAGLAGLGTNAVLVFLSVPNALRMRDELLAEWARAGLPETEGSDSRFFLPIGGWASNSEPRGIFIPDEGFDPCIYDEGAGNVSFVEEIRGAFVWGGFPAWSYLARDPRSKHVGVPGPVPDAVRVLSVLQEGLVPV